MEKHYNIRKRLSKIAFGVFLAGVATGGGGLYYAVTPPTQPPILVKYEKIERELDRYPRVKLRNIKSRSSDLIPRADQLEADAYEIEISPTFTKAREEYEREKKSNNRIGSRVFGGGLVVGLSSLLLSVFLSPGRRRKNGEEDGEVNRIVAEKV